jgi:MFS family permease
MQLSEQDVKRGLRISVVEGSLANLHAVLTGGVFLTGLAVYLGATDIEIGLLSSIPAFLAPAGFIAAILVSWIGHRKPITIFSSGLGRALFLVPGIVVLLGYKMRVESLILLVSFYNALLVIAGNTWTSWMADLVPITRRGRYFGTRNTILGLVGMVASTAGTYFLDSMKARGLEVQGFGWAFLAAGFFSTCAAVLLTRQPHIKVMPYPVPILHMFTSPFRNVRFRRFILFVAFWSFVAPIAGPFYLVHMLKNLHMSYSLINVYSILGGISGLAFQWLWGKAIDRLHAKPVLEINIIGVGFMPALWLFVRPDFLLPIWLDSFFSGIFWTGVGAAFFNLLLHLSHEARSKESYIAVYTATTGILNALSTFVGGLIANALGKFEFHFAGQTFVNYHVLFFGASVLRFSSLILFAFVEQPEAETTRNALAAMGDYAKRNITKSGESLKKAFKPRKGGGP